MGGEWEIWGVVTGNSMTGRVDGGECILYHSVNKKAIISIFCGTLKMVLQCGIVAGGTVYTAWNSRIVRDVWNMTNNVPRKLRKTEDMDDVTRYTLVGRPLLHVPGKREEPET